MNNDMQEQAGAVADDVTQAAPATAAAQAVDTAEAEMAQAAGSAPRAFFRPKPDGSVDPAGEAGWYLERERERRGLSLQTASRATGVHPQHLRAIELGMLENLPERAEALRMIGAYARFLGFDPQPLVAHFETCLPRQEQPKAFSSARIISFPLARRLRDFTRTPGGMSASVLALVLLFGGLSWAVWPSGDAARQDGTVATAQAGKDEKAASQAADTAGRAAEAAPSAQPVQADATGEKVIAEGKGAGKARPAADPIAALIARTVPGVEQEQQAQPQATEQAAAATPKTPDAGGEAAASVAAPVPPPDMDMASPSDSAAATAPEAQPIDPQAVKPLDAVPEKGIALRASEQIWLRLEDDAGLPWFVGFLKPGQVLALPVDRSLRLSASDVHRLEWYVNGRRMGRLGKRGADFLSEPLGALYRQSGMQPPGGRKGGRAG